MYERHIEELLKAPTQSEAHALAVGAAIALMRAAEPKDEAAEREHCREALAQIPFLRDAFRERAETVVMRERAAARAGEALYADPLYTIALRDRATEAVERAQLRAELKCYKAAGQPQDAEAERRHCEQAALKLDERLWAHSEDVYYARVDAMKVTRKGFLRACIANERESVRAGLRVELQGLEGLVAQLRRVVEEKDELLSKQVQERIQAFHRGYEEGYERGLAGMDER